MDALTVTHAFGDYGIGDRIEGADAIKKALAEHPSSVVKVKLEQPEKPEPKTTPSRSAAAS